VSSNSARTEGLMIKLQHFPKTFFPYTGGVVYLFRYLLYVAESPANPLAKYLYLGTFGESPKASRPIVILYDVQNLAFSPLETIPPFYSAGDISWKPDSSGIVGLAWWNHPFPMGCPGCANRRSQVRSMIFDKFILLFLHLFFSLGFCS
jgi:hypothetical protein